MGNTLIDALNAEMLGDVQKIHGEIATCKQYAAAMAVKQQEMAASAVAMQRTWEGTAREFEKMARGILIFAQDEQAKVPTAMAKTQEEMAAAAAAMQKTLESTATQFEVMAKGILIFAGDEQARLAATQDTQQKKSANIFLGQLRKVTMSFRVQLWAMSVLLGANFLATVALLLSHHN